MRFRVPFPLLLILGLLVASSAEAQTLRVGVLDASRHGLANIGNGPIVEELRASLRQHIVELGFEDLAFVRMRRLTAEVLAPDADDGVDIVILHASGGWTEPMVGALDDVERVALLAFVEAGGSAVILSDPCNDPGFRNVDSMLEPFGIEAHGLFEDGWVATIEPDHPVTDGPFGEVLTWAIFCGGWFTDLGPFATSLAEFPGSSDAILAVIEEDALGSGSGRVLLAGDANWFADSAEGGYFQQQEVMFLNAMAWLSEHVHEPAGARFLRADCNGNGAVDISDAICILNWLFIGAGEPSCIAAANPNGDAAVDISDASHLLNYLFLGGPAPVAPFPECGPLPDAEPLSCETPPGDCDAP
jgi:hypothetical protein